MSETTEAVRARMTYHDREYDSRTHSHDSLSFHDGDMAALLEDWALPIAEERDALAAEVERLRAAIVAIDLNVWADGRELRADCPFCGEVSTDGLELPHGMGCVWWEIKQETTP